MEIWTQRKYDLKRHKENTAITGPGGVEAGWAGCPHPRVTPSMRQAKGKGEPRTVPLTEACMFTNHIQRQCATENISPKAFFVLGGAVGAKTREAIP